jgi:hypothetical protein
LVVPFALFGNAPFPLYFAHYLLAFSLFVSFIGGDEFSYPDWLNNLEPSVITRKNTLLGKNDYRLFVGMTSHGIIGPESGASLYGLLNKKRKILMLNNTLIGSALQNSIVSYPKIYFKIAVFK